MYHAVKCRLTKVFYFLATRYDSRRVQSHIRGPCFEAGLTVVQIGAHAGRMDPAIGPGVYACVRAWALGSLRGRYSATPLSSILRILHRLSGAVRLYSHREDVALTTIHRVLLACIRFLAKCPCPRCYIKKEDIPGLGTVLDKRRRDNIRLDNATIQADIEIARILIYLQGYSVNSQRVESLLKERSLQPVQVSVNDPLSSVRS